MPSPFRTSMMFTPTKQNSPLAPSAPSASSEGLLTLKSIVGATTCSGSGLDCSSNTFAYVAGAAAVVVKLDQNLKPTQQFYRAKPNFATVSKGPTTPTPSSRVSMVGLSPAVELLESPTTKSWSAKDKIKAATCVSLSGDGRYLAVGEVSYREWFTGSIH
jgi:hypothetical protein